MTVQSELIRGRIECQLATVEFNIFAADMLGPEIYIKVNTYRK